MGYLELEISLPDEAKAMREMARKFGMEVMRPAGIVLDKMADPSEPISQEGELIFDDVRVLKNIR